MSELDDIKKRKDYEEYKQYLNDNLYFIIDIVLKNNSITKDTKSSQLTDEKFDELINQIKDITKKHFSDFEIRNSLAKRLFNLLKDDGVKK